MDESSNKRKKVKVAIILLLVGFIFGIMITILVYYRFLKKGEDKEEKVVYIQSTSQQFVEYDKVSVEYITRKLEKVDRLLTAEMSYSSSCTIGDGQIPLITKKGFTMMYTANIMAGINLSDIDIEVSDNLVRIILPHSYIQVVKVDPQSIAIFDEKQALFNRNKSAEVVDAIVIAEDSARKMADLDGICKEADENSEKLIKSLFEDAIGNRVLVVSFK